MNNFDISIATCIRGSRHSIPIWIRGKEFAIDVPPPGMASNEKRLWKVSSYLNIVVESKVTYCFGIWTPIFRELWQNLGEVVPMPLHELVEDQAILHTLQAETLLQFERKPLNLPIPKWKPTYGVHSLTVEGHHGMRCIAHEDSFGGMIGFALRNE